MECDCTRIGACVSAGVPGRAVEELGRRSFSIRYCTYLGIMMEGCHQRVLVSWHLDLEAVREDLVRPNLPWDQIKVANVPVIV
jgi:hypothetical protein